MLVDEIELFNSSGAIFLRADGRLYGVNGLASAYLRGIGEDLRDVSELQRPHGELPEMKMDATPLFDLARQLEQDTPAAPLSRSWWRRRQADGTKVLLFPLLFVTKMLSLILNGVAWLIRRPGGKLVAAVVVLLGVGVVWLTTGILLQEVVQAFSGLWQEPFWDHAIFFVIAAPLSVVALVAIVVSQMSGGDS